MMRTVRFWVFLPAIAAFTSNAFALPLSPLITYQGQIKQNNVPINGLTDLEFTLWDAAAGGAQVGPTHTQLNVDIVNGLFTANLDFTPIAFNGEARWIEIRVRYPAGVDPYVLLSNRQLITTTPYAQAVRLPLAESIAGTSDLFSITNTGASGAAGVFTATNVGHLGPVLRATASGAGTAFTATTPAGGTAISATSGLGRAGSFNGGGSLPALVATNSSTGAAINAVNSGTGPALLANGNIAFNDDLDGIIFNLTVAPNAPMISMFPFGTANAPRMVIAHSPGFPDYGLQFDDTTDQFHFQGNGVNAVSVDLTRPDTSASDGGFLVVGEPSAANLSLDNNEIMARNSGAVATLALNADGGDVTISQSSSTGSVGIGTSNPQGTLHVSGGADAEPVGGGLLVLGFTSSGNLALDGNEIMARNNGATSTLSLNADGGNVAMCQSGGNVGIGTSNPQGVLHIASGADSEPADGGILVLGFTNGGNLSLDGNEIVARNNGTTSPLYLNNDGGNVHMAVAGGGVSIGTNYIPPGVLLAVDGKIMCEEMEVQLSGDWPDYVFDEAYPLMPLAELEQSIATNKHLPGIPSAAQVQKEGVNVGEIQGKLLEKIEELTLYMIETNKQLDSVRADNAQLRARLAALEGGR